MFVFFLASFWRFSVVCLLEHVVRSVVCHSIALKKAFVGDIVTVIKILKSKEEFVFGYDAFFLQ